MTPDEITPGAFLAWRTWTGAAAVVRVFHVDRFSITADEPDGQLFGWHATACRSLAEQLAHVRPATAEEVQHFTATARPWAGPTD